jgi:hypothetical protein
MRWPAIVSKGHCSKYQETLTYLLAEVSNGLIIFVEDNANLVHQPNLFFIVTVQLRRARIDVGEKSQNALSRDGLSLSNCRCRRHV